MTELQPHELQILSSVITSKEAKQDMAKALWNTEIMVSMGQSVDMLQSVEHEMLKKVLLQFMEKHEIEEEEYDNVFAFYNKAYAAMRTAFDTSDQATQNHAPGIWERRMKFLDDLNIKKGRTRATMATKTVPYLVEEYGYKWMELNNHVLPENALCYVVSTMSLNSVHEATVNAVVSYMEKQLDAKSWYELYKGVKNFDKASNKKSKS